MMVRVGTSPSAGWSLLMTVNETVPMGLLRGLGQLCLELHDVAPMLVTLVNQLMKLQKSVAMD